MRQNGNASKPTMTPDERQALTAYAHQIGRRWKSSLLSAWESGNYRSAPAGLAPALQSIRNARGPSWLKTVKLG